MSDQIRICAQDGDLVIRIPIGTMIYAFENDQSNEGWDGNQHVPPKVMNRDGFVADVLRQLGREEEDGTTPVHRMMDKAMLDAVEDGSEHVQCHGDSTALAMQKS